MSYAQRHSLTLTTSATSTANDFTPVVTGAFHSILYHVGTSAYTTTATLTVTVERTSQVLYNSTAWNTTTNEMLIVPRSVIHNTAGTTILGDAPFQLADDRINVLVASVGAGKTGTFDLFVN